MSGKRYSEEFKIEAVKQVTERGYKVTDVCRRLGITSASLHKWIKLYGDAGSQHQQISEQRSLPRSPSKVSLHQGSPE